MMRKTLEIKITVNFCGEPALDNSYIRRAASAVRTISSCHVVVAYVAGFEISLSLGLVVNTLTLFFFSYILIFYCFFFKSISASFMSFLWCIVSVHLDYFLVIRTIRNNSAEF